MDRRSVLQFVSLSALYPGSVAGQHCAAERMQSPYVRKFFDAGEHAALAEMMELIIPADAHSPGAREARTADFADWMIFHSSADLQRVWRDGLKVLTPVNLAEAAANELAPMSDRDRFFARLKNMTIDGYYTSQTGIHRDLGYKGNQFLRRFEGCTHPEHQG